MVQAKKCARCGCMYISESEVCGKCKVKDGADLYKLKGFLEKGYGVVNTPHEIAVATGISNKNLSRFLKYDEFKGVCGVGKAKTKAASGNEVEGINGGVELV